MQLNLKIKNQNNNLTQKWAEDLNRHSLKKTYRWSTDT